MQRRSLLYPNPNLSSCLGIALTVIGLMFQGCNTFPYEDCSGIEIIDTKYVHKYGMTVPKEHWEESGRNGRVVKILKEGVVCSQTYDGGALDGETTYTFPFSEEIEKTQIYSAGVLTKETIYFRQGHPKEETVFDPSGERTTKGWYENGSLKNIENWNGDSLTSGEYFDIKQQRMSGIANGSGERVKRDAYGQLMATDHYHEGKIEFITLYYPNGSPKEVTPYQNGVVEGIRKTYFPGGEPQSIEVWKKGRQEGITTLFQDGIKVEEVPYAEGMRNGKALIYKEGSTVIKEVSWKNDKLHGPTHTYIDGIKATDWYLRGNKVTKSYYDSFHLLDSRQEQQNKQDEAG